MTDIKIVKTELMIKPVKATLRTTIDGSRKATITLTGPYLTAGLWSCPLPNLKAALKRLGDPKGWYTFSDITFMAVDKNGYTKMVIYPSGST